MASVLTRSVHTTRRFRASPERVLAAWLEPALARRWLFATATRPATRVEIDARVGGSFRIVDGGRDAEHFGIYIDIDPPSRLVFALALEGEQEAATRVSVHIEPAGNGCVVTVVHDGLPRERVRMLANRWCGMLYGLAEILASMPAARRRTRPLFPQHSTLAWRNAP